MGVRSLVQRRNRLEKRLRRAKMYASHVQGQGPKECSQHTLQTFPLTSRGRTPLPPLHNLTPDQALLAKNYDENARHADRNPRGIFRTPTDASAAPVAGLVDPLGASSFSLPTIERALAEMEGYLGRCTGVGAPTSTLPTLGARQVRLSMKFYRTSLTRWTLKTAAFWYVTGCFCECGCWCEQEDGAEEVEWECRGGVSGVGIRRQIGKRNGRWVGFEGESVSYSVSLQWYISQQSRDTLELIA